MLDANNYERYESPELIEWKKLSHDEQFKIVNSYSDVFKDRLEVSSVKNQAIEVNLFVDKKDVYDFLVKYENYIREKLGNFPVIILLKDRIDENKKRK
ncbi:MAG: hypothetical protein U5K55_03390 [Aliarcobacter sp.]|jgi:hypothetical protein|nr:hypothetical protein [Aliarcobacter sp.]